MTTDLTSSPRIGIVGVGEMGRPLVDRLLRAGRPVAAYARRPELRAELAAAGVDMAASAAELARGCDILLLFPFSDAQVREIALEDGVVDAMAPGAVLVIHTTGSPFTAAEIARRATPLDVMVVDAPVSGGPHKMADGTITLFVGGDEAALARCRPLFADYAGPVLHAGPPGSGQRTKLINNIMFGAHIQLAIEAARVGRELGLQAGDLARMLGHGSGNSAALEIVAAIGSPEDLMARASRFIRKDVDVASAIAAELRIDLGLLAAVVAPLQGGDAEPSAAAVATDRAAGA